MKSHSNKGRYLISKAILESNWIDNKLRVVALDCCLAYEISFNYKQQQIRKEKLNQINLK